MRKIIVAALMAATVMPSAAMAQSRGEIRRDRQDVREERRELNRAIRRGESPREIREERRELQGARRELREDQWDRRGYVAHRSRYRNVYRGGNWTSPYRYQSFRPGLRIGAGYYGQRYWIADPYRYRLPNPGYNRRWVRHYNDVLLVDVRRGYVIDVIRNFYW